MWFFHCWKVTQEHSSRVTQAMFYADENRKKTNSIIINFDVMYYVLR